MKYDSYNPQRIYKPRFAKICRDILYRRMLQGLGVRSICDIGVGFGELAHYCGENSIPWVGIEPNDNLRTKLQQQGFPVYKATLPDFPPITEPIDAMVASHMIEHLNGAAEVLQFLERVREELKQRNGRYLILLYPDIEKCGYLFFHDYTHSFITTKKRVHDLLHDTGWRVIRSRRYTACFFALSGLVSAVGKIFPFFLLPERLALFARLSFQQHMLTIAVPADE